MLTKKQKKEVIQQLADILKNSKTVVFTSFDKINVEDQRELRKNLKENQADYHVFKKTLLKIALEETKQDIDLSNVFGSIGLAYSSEDEMMPIKEVINFNKEHEEVEAFSCLIDEKVINAKEIKRFADLPSREVLLTQVVGTVAAPMSGLVNVLGGNLRGLVNVLKAKSQEGSN